MLSNEQVDWLNTYNNQTRVNLEPLLQNYPDVYKYLIEKTEPFKYSHAYEYCPTYIKYQNSGIRLTSFPIQMWIYFSSIFLTKLFF